MERSNRNSDIQRWSCRHNMIKGISIVISNYSYSYLLPLVMQSYNQMEKPTCDVELVIVDDSSDPDDHFEEFIRLGYDRIKPWFKVRAFKMPLSCSKMNWGRTLNVGVKQSKSDMMGRVFDVFIWLYYTKNWDWEH